MSYGILKRTLGSDPASDANAWSISEDHETPRDARRLEAIADLYEKFPHWAERLEYLWREVENPRPIGRLDHWTDKRKDSRWSTWWIVLGLVFAILFGLIASVLGALQVWISYCSWMEDPGVLGCSAKLVSSRAAVRD
jgi:hypothetical protein